MKDLASSLSAFKSGSLITAVLPGKKKRRSYRVDLVDGDRAVLYEMWRRESDRVWVQSPQCHIVALSELKEASQARSEAPKPDTSDA